MMYTRGSKERYVRLGELDSRSSSFLSNGGRMNRCSFNIEGPSHASDKSSKMVRNEVLKGSRGLKFRGRSLRFGGNKGNFSEDLNVYRKMIFNPHDKFLRTCNRLFFISCILAILIDPLFFYLPKEHESKCLGMDVKLATTTTIIRTLIDAFYLFRMALQFRTAFVPPSSQGFGRRELVTVPAEIANRYLRGYFIIDLLSVLPIPQIIVWNYLKSTRAAAVPTTKTALLVTLLIQYVPRFFRIFPLTSELKSSSGVLAETAWVAAAIYLLWYIVASHIVGALWYYISSERVDTCWHHACRNSTIACRGDFLYCGDGHPAGFEKWKINSTTVLNGFCGVADDNTNFDFGIFGDAVKYSIIKTGSFVTKYCYCLWWGLKNLSTLGQGLETSTYPGEVIFSISVAIVGLILFALLIGNMQTYLQSLTKRLEEMRVKRNDSEEWMHHRLLPAVLRERVRRYDQYKWFETRGVDEEGLVQSLPKDLKRDIKRHLCLALVKRVPLFNSMDEQLLDAICERLKPSLYTEKTYIVREGDPVDEMLFIIRGRLESETTDGGRTGFFNRIVLEEGDFCGEELLTWALDPKPGIILPSSTRTVKSLTEVEAFALMAEELKFVANQFKRLHSRQVLHTFRFHSQQWRTRAANTIQAAWRRYSMRKMA